MDKIKDYDGDGRSIFVLKIQSAFEYINEKWNLYCVL